MTFRLIKTIVLLGAAPETPQLHIEMTPVDFLCRAILHLTTRQDGLGKSYHFRNPNPIGLSRLIESMNTEGYRIRTLPAPEWLEEVRRAGDNEEQNPLAPVLPFFFPERNDPEHRTESVHVPSFDLSNMLGGLKGSGIACPPVDDRLLEVYFRYLTDQGYLPGPRPAVKPRCNQRRARSLI